MSAAVDFSQTLEGSLPLSNASETLLAVDSGDEFMYVAVHGGAVRAFCRVTCDCGDSCHTLVVVFATSRSRDPTMVIQYWRWAHPVLLFKTHHFGPERSSTR